MSAGIFGLGVDASSAAATVAQSLGQGAVVAKSAASGSSTSASSTASSASGDISSNDFLTLLVTEMKNQDPTQPTDPNAYIQQLTEVNSLQQLIAINQDLSSSTSAGSGATEAVTGTSGV